MNSIATMSTSPETCFPKQTREMGEVLETLGRSCLAALLFVYVTAPVWGVRIAEYYGLNTVLSGDLLLLAICWMPASATIIHLSFIKPKKGAFIGSLIFTALNTFALGLTYLLGFLPV